MAGHKTKVTPITVCAERTRASPGGVLLPLPPGTVLLPAVLGLAFVTGHFLLSLTPLTNVPFKRLLALFSLAEPSPCCPSGPVTGTACQQDGISPVSKQPCHLTRRKDGGIAPSIPKLQVAKSSPEKLRQAKHIRPHRRIVLLGGQGCQEAAGQKAHEPGRSLHWFHAHTRDRGIPAPSIRLSWTQRD